jgi:hypothetical protein
MIGLTNVRFWIKANIPRAIRGKSKAQAVHALWFPIQIDNFVSGNVIEANCLLSHYLN